MENSAVFRLESPFETDGTFVNGAFCVDRDWPAELLVPALLLLKFVDEKSLLMLFKPSAHHS